MNPKLEITLYVARELNLPLDQKSIKNFQRLWFNNIRNKPKGAFRLTKEGFEALTNAQIKTYKIRLEEVPLLTNKVIIYLDNFINCPWFMNNKWIYVFGEKMAVQLILFGGNVEKFAHSRARAQKQVDTE